MSQVASRILGASPDAAEGFWIVQEATKPGLKPSRKETFLPGCLTAKQAFTFLRKRSNIPGKRLCDLKNHGIAEYTTGDGTWHTIELVYKTRERTLPVVDQEIGLIPDGSEATAP